MEETDTRESIAHFVGLVRDGFEWAQANPDKWGEGWASESGLPVSTTSEVAAKKVSVVGPVTEEHVASEQQLADAFFEAGQIPEKVDFNTVVEPGLIE